MYLPGAQTFVEVRELQKPLCGASRPGHFAGVATVVAKLFLITQPHLAVFGEKDYQQLAIIRRMVRDLDFAIEIASVPIVREADGLAMSSRNTRLSTDERAAAPVLWRALSDAQALVGRGVGEAGRIREQMEAVVSSQPLARLDDAAVVDLDTWEDVEHIRRPVRLLLAARFGATRLIDNATATPPAAGSPAWRGERGE
jgi:pantoate--beta-alanine ligase